MKIMLVRPDYAKNYASTIYSSLVTSLDGSPLVHETAHFFSTHFLSTNKTQDWIQVRLEWKAKQHMQSRRKLNAYSTHKLSCKNQEDANDKGFDITDPLILLFSCPL